MKKLDTAKMQEYANRALTECSTMEEVLELSKEYVDSDNDWSILHCSLLVFSLVYFTIFLKQMVVA